MRAAVSRKLSETESNNFRRSLQAKWNFSFAQPQSLGDGLAQSIVIVAKDDMTEEDYNQLIQLISLYTSHVLELGENDTVREYPVTAFHPDSVDALFCDESFQWIIYASFDGRLTFGGEWLTALVKKIFSGRKDKIVIKKKRNRSAT